MTDKGSQETETAKPRRNEEESVDTDLAAFRMRQISETQASKLYGKGLSLLKKAGLKEDDSLTAPMKVYVRRAREGLKDDDSRDRRVLGEQTTDKPDTDAALLDMSTYTAVLPKVVEYLSVRGGSARLSGVFKNIVKREIPSCTLTVFRLIMETDVQKHGLRLVDQELVLSRPPSRTPASLNQCVCLNSLYFKSKHLWAAHVLADFNEGHEVYEQELMRLSSSGRWFYCLVCNRPMQDLVRIIKHCHNMEDSDHKYFGSTVIVGALDPADSICQTMLFQAMHDGDSDYPWQCKIEDMFEGLSPQEIPGTPICLSDGEVEIEEIIHINSFSDDEDVVVLE